MQVIARIDRLYKTRIKPPDYADFIDKIRELVKDENFTLLN